MYLLKHTLLRAEVAVTPTMWAQILAQLDKRGSACGMQGETSLSHTTAKVTDRLFHVEHRRVVDLAQGFRTVKEEIFDQLRP